MERVRQLVHTLFVVVAVAEAEIDCMDHFMDEIRFHFGRGLRADADNQVAVEDFRRYIVDTEIHFVGDLDSVGLAADLDLFRNFHQIHLVLWFSD